MNEQLCFPIHDLDLPSNREIIVDNFAGGGGASKGIEAALGHVDVAINHDPKAIAMHIANHPNTEHFVQSITTIDPLEATGGRPVGLAWFSPDCKHFSKAKGSAPKARHIRDLAWVVVDWAQKVKPRVIILENVEEFTTWGPLLECGRPCPDSRGLTFLQWVKELRQAGYRVEWRELRASEYGAPTTRKRLFVVARRDNLPIVWPKPTHGPGLKPFRTAAECIDFSLPCPSIFKRKKPLVKATLRRVARGVQKYVLEAGEPFVIPLTHQGDSRVYDLNEPMRTITTARRGEFAFVAPWFVPRYGERPTQDPRTRSVERPLSTIVTTGNGSRLCAAFLAQHNLGSIGHPVKKPISTIMSTGSQQQLVSSHLMIQRRNQYGQSLDSPVRTITSGANHFGEVRTLLEQHGGKGPKEPAIVIDGTTYNIVDIGMRMLSPRELFRAQGFPDDYIIDPIFNGRPLSKTDQVKCCGNSVCPPMAEAMVRANYQIRSLEATA